MRNCVVRGCKRVGLKCFDNGGGTFVRVRFERCGAQGARLMQSADVSFLDCTFQECGEEGVVAMEDARVALTRCTLGPGNKGPGIDASGRARVQMGSCHVAGNVGGLWLWDHARAAMGGCTVAGGASHALLADASSLLAAQDTTIDGQVQCTASAWSGITRDASNAWLEPKQPVSLPPEEGPFLWDPLWYERKQ